MNKLIIIPFDGFYHSITDMYIDDVVTLEHDYIKDELGLELPEKFYDYQVKSFEVIARRYVEEYKDWLKSEHGLTLDSLTFESLNSPREYNFTTDRIFCELSTDDIRKLHAFALLGAIDKAIDETFKSRDGFSSFYDDFVDEWRTKPVLDWDHNELAVLLPTPDNYGDVWEAAFCNGFFDDQIEWAHNTNYESYTTESKEVQK